jgi:hypothetical protein
VNEDSGEWAAGRRSLRDLRGGKRMFFSTKPEGLGATLRPECDAQARNDEREELVISPWESTLLLTQNRSHLIHCLDCCGNGQ